MQRSNTPAGWKGWLLLLTLPFAYLALLHQTAALLRPWLGQWASVGASCLMALALLGLLAQTAPQLLLTKRPPVRKAAALLAAGAGLAFLGALPAALGQVLPLQSVSLLTVLGVVLAGPFAEEAFYRGILLKLGEERMGVWGASAFSCLVFALAHPLGFSTAAAGLCGAVLCLLHYKGCSLWELWAVHGLANALLFARGAGGLGRLAPAALLAAAAALLGLCFWLLQKSGKENPV